MVDAMADEINKELFDHLGYQFNNNSLLQVALTHCSMPGENNERMEFLGDALLNFIVAEELFKRYPNVKEGDLSRLRANLVNGEVLAEIAKELQLGEYLKLSRGEIKAGGQKRNTILADAVEAVIAAIYLDSDITQCKDRIVAWLSSRIDKVTEGPSKDPKSLLQEYLQKEGLDIPLYNIIKIEGDRHQQVFY